MLQLLFRARLVVLPGLLLTLLIAAPAGAQSLYSAEVPLDDTADNPRLLAYEEALSAVLLRVSGSSLSSDPEQVSLLFPDPSSYVVQFRPAEDNRLWVSFDGDAIEATLRRAGQLIWGTERPSTLVWLAVDWGEGEREIVSANDLAEEFSDDGISLDRNRLLRERVLEMAERRGIPVLFPLLDAEDIAAVSFADIWGGFDEQAIYASQRYNVDSVLIGRIRADDPLGNRWNYYFGDEQLAWSGQPEVVVGLVADRLAAEFAIGGDALPSLVRLGVSGVNSVDAFGAVQTTLADIAVIDTLALLSVEGDRMFYEVNAHGGAERLARALRISGLLQVEQPGDLPFAEGVLEFFYNP